MNKEKVDLSITFMVLTILVLVVFFLDLLIKGNISQWIMLIIAAILFISACMYYEQAKKRDENSD